MKKLLLLLILSFFSAQSFAAGCPDGSEPVKSISADGTYFVFNCANGNEQASSATANSKAGTVKVAMKPDTGDWISSDGLPMWSAHFAKRQISKSSEINKFIHLEQYAIGDFDNDGVDDYFQLGRVNQPGQIWTEEAPACDTTVGECFVQSGSLSVFQVEQTKWFDSWRYTATDMSDLLINTNPLEMAGTLSNKIMVTDFNGDGKLDIFTTDTGSILDGQRPGKNDIYFLSNEGVGWTESTSTHVTGPMVRNGKGLINFSHGASAGDIDGDGDMDIIVTSIEWVGNNGELLCYINQGDGHMKVRKCGNQWGKTAELGDIDNDGDLDVVFGGATHASAIEWNTFNTIPGCNRSRCNGAFNGILLNDGTGNFYQRGFSFADDVKNSSGFSYWSVSGVSVSDLDSDGDLDVIRMHVGKLYAGEGITIEENIGNGKFKTVLYSEFCPSPKSKAEWPKNEGSFWNCWSMDFKFGDFNKDGFVDIVVDGHDADRSDVVQDGAIYMSTGKFTYDIVWPTDKDYPLLEIKINKQPKVVAEDTLAQAKAIAKRKAEVAAVKAKRLAEEAAKAAETDTVDTEQQSVEDEIAAFEAELAAELGE